MILLIVTLLALFYAIIYGYNVFFSDYYNHIRELYYDPYKRHYTTFYGIIGILEIVYIVLGFWTTGQVASLFLFMAVWQTLWPLIPADKLIGNRRLFCLYMGVSSIINMFIIAALWKTGNLI